MTTAVPTAEDVLERVEDLGPPGTPVTTPEVAERFDCTKRTIYNRLNSLVEDSVLETKKVGANSRVWWRPVKTYPNLDGERDTLRESEAKYRTLFESINDGFCIIEVLFDDDGEQEDYRFVETNPVFEDITGLTDVEGTLRCDLESGYDPCFFNIYGQVAQTGESKRFEASGEPLIDGWFDISVFPFGEQDSNEVALLLDNITRRKEAENELEKQAELDAFRVTLTDAIRPLTDPADIQREAARVLGEHLDVDRANYAEVLEDGNTNIVHADYCREGVESLVGEHHFEDYGEYIADTFRSGDTLVLDDLPSIPDLDEEERAAHRRMDNAAYIGVPLIKDGQLTAYCGVTQGTPREWTEPEVAMVEATAERTWAAVERARIEQELRESEERLDAFVTTTSEVIYRMSPDWSELYYLDGQEFIVDAEEPRETWLTEYIPADEQERVMDAIDEAIETKSTFELEHQIVQTDGSRGWVHSRAVPMLDDDGEITEWFGTATDITERKEAEQELRDTRELLEIALDVEDMGVWEFNPQTHESPYRSPRHSEIFGYDVPVEDWSLERFLDHVHPEDREEVPERFEAALESGDWEFEGRIVRADEKQRWIRTKGTYFYEDETPVRGVGTIQDITERKEAEQKLLQQAELDAFRVDLIDAIRPLADPVEIQREAARVLGEQLDVKRGNYSEVLADENTNIIQTGYSRGDISSIAGRHQLDAYGSYIREAFRAGESVVIDDLSTLDELSDGERAQYEEVEIAALIGVPLVKDDRLEAFFAVTESTPREWTDIEVEMVEVTADLTWAAVERAHAEQNLRESEERYRTLFESIDEGFCIIEVLFDEDDHPVDLRFLETNPAFEGQTGLTDAEGERMRDLAPDLEEHWYEIYGRIAQTGEAERFQNEAKNIGHQWYDIYAFRIGDPEERKVAILFNDISKLKHTQQALERLTVASRELIDVETETINNRVAELTVDVLNVEYAALWRYDETSGELTEATRAFGTGINVDTVRHPDDASEQIWQAFIGDRIAVSDDLSVDDTVQDGATLRSRLLIPLCRHGVVCVGSLQSNVFDGRIIDLAETLGATVETAWDRSDSEQQLERQNEELTYLNRLNTLIRAIDGELVDAGTVAGIDEAVCERLASSGLFEFAWVGGFNADADAIRPRAWAGIDSHTLEELTTASDSVSADRDPFSSAIRTHELQVVADIATGAQAAPWREVALKHGARSCLAIPLVYDESVYGVLAVYGRTPQHNHRDADVLTELGDTIAHAINAVEARETLRTDSVVELTLRTTDATTPLCRLARQLDCSIEFEGLVPGDDDDATVFFTISNAPVADVLAAGENPSALDALTCLVEEDEENALFRARTTEPTLASLFVEGNAVVRSLMIDRNGATGVVDVFRADRVSEFLDQLRRSIPDLEMLARRTQSRPLETRQTFRRTFEDRLTPRQLEVLHMAYRSGFFQSPRVQTGKELATTLDISPATFTHHLRKAERQLCEMVFEST